jgi:hypothetical protein
MGFIDEPWCRPLATPVTTGSVGACRRRVLVPAIAALSLTLGFAVEGCGSSTVSVSGGGTIQNAGVVQQIARGLGTTSFCQPPGEGPQVFSPSVIGDTQTGIAAEVRCDGYSVVVYVFQDQHYLQNEINLMGYQNGIDLVGTEWEAAVADNVSITQVQSAIGGTIVPTQ